MALFEFSTAATRTGIISPNLIFFSQSGFQLAFLLRSMHEMHGLSFGLQFLNLFFSRDLDSIEFSDDVHFHLVIHQFKKSKPFFFVFNQRIFLSVAP